MNCAIPKSVNRLLRPGALIQVCAVAVCLLYAFKPAQGQSTYTLPPRTVEDVLAVLDQYKPDPAAVEKIRAIFNAQPPQTEDKRDLVRFYYDRAWAADSLGAINRSIEDFRKARELIRGTDGEAEVEIIQALSNALFAGGNYLEALKTREELLPMISNMGGRQNTVNYAFVLVYSFFGDVESARAALKRQEEGYNATRFSPFVARWGWHFQNCFMYGGARARLVARTQACRGGCRVPRIACRLRARSTHG